MHTDPSRKLLILSDLHLGRDAGEITGADGLRPDPGFDRSFIELLDVYTSARENDWRLILSGDLLDFDERQVRRKHTRWDPLQLLLRFEVATPAPETAPAEADAEAKAEAEAEAAALARATPLKRRLRQLDQLIDVHQALFRRLAHFLREGGQLVIVRGDHDAALHWDKLQTALRRRLASFAFQNQKMSVDEALEARNAFQARLRFCPWMYHEAHRVYVEHGHQYDVYASFDRQLFPVRSDDPQRLETPALTAAMRCFVRGLAGFTPEFVDHWRGRDYLGWLQTQGPGGVLYVLRAGAQVSYRALRHSFRLLSGADKEFSQEHHKRLGQEAARFGLSEDQVLLADRLRHVPVHRNLPELLRLLFLDRLLLIAAALLLCYGVLLGVDSHGWALFWIGMIGSAVYQLHRRLVPRRYLLPGPKQAQAARRLAKIFQVPNVVMGHSHVRRVVPLKQGGAYFNPGAWLPPVGQPAHRDPQQPCDCRLPHLVIDGVQGRLRNYCPVTKLVREADADLRGCALEVELDLRA